MRLITLITLLLLTSFVFAQKKTKYLYFQAADKSVSLYPFYKVIDKNYHPAFSLGLESELRNKNKSVMFYTAEITWYSHAMLGAGVTINSGIGFRFLTNSGFFVENIFGLGTTIFSPARKSYQLNNNGEYEPKNSLRIMLAIPVDIGVGYQRGAFAFYCRYRYMLEYPFIDIMPFIPTSLLSVGVKYKINK